MRWLLAVLAIAGALWFMHGVFTAEGFTSIQAWTGVVSVAISCYVAACFGTFLLKGI